LQSPNQKIDIHTHVLPKNLPDLKSKYGYRKTWAATRHDGDTITYLQPIVKDLIAPQ